jgi:WD40 repeat protein
MNRLANFLLAICNLLALGAVSLSHADGRERVDVWGDPLPAHAVARLGTVRLRQSESIVGIALAPDATRLVTGSKYGLLCCWDVATGKQLFRIKSGKGTVHPLYSVDGKHLLTGDALGLLRVYDAQTGAEREKLEAHREGITALAVSPDGTVLVTAGKDDTVKVWNWPARKVTASWSTDQSLSEVALSPDKRRILGVDEDRIGCWEGGSGRLLYAVEQAERPHWPQTLAVPQRGETFASADVFHGVISLRRISDGKVIRSLRGHEEGIYSMCFSPDDRTLVSCGGDGTIRLWQVEDGKEVGRLPGPHWSPSNILYSTDGKLIVALESRGTIRVWDARTHQDLTRRLGHFCGVRDLAYAPSGEVIATAGYDGLVRIWDPASGKCLRVLQEHRACLWRVAFSPDGRRLASGDSAGMICLWDTATWQLEGRIEGHHKLIDTLGFSPADGTLLSVNGDNRVVGAEGWARFWDPVTRKELRRFRSRDSFLRFSPDGKVLVSFADSRTRFLDPQTGKVLSAIPADRAWGCFFGDGARFLQGAYDSERVDLWDWRNGARLSSFTIPLPERMPHAVLSPDDRLVGLGYVDGTVRLVQVGTGKLVRELQGHTDTVNALAFSPDGSTLASASEDSTALLWGLVQTPRGTVAPLPAKELDNLWGHVANEDIQAAYTAIWRLAGHPESSLPLLQARLRPVRRADPAVVGPLLRALDADAFERREKATTELAGLGAAAESVLRRTLNQTDLSPEARSRITQILDRLEHSADWKQQTRGVIVLEYIRSAAARELLKRLAEGDAGSQVTAEAAEACRRLSK